MAALDDYLRAASLVRPLLQSDAVRDRWQHPSALAEWSVGGLAGHLVWSALNLDAAVGAPTADVADAPPLDAVSYFANTPAPTAETAVGARIREKGDDLAAHGHGHVVATFDKALAELTRARGTVDPGCPVEVLGRVVTVDTFARTRLMELLVHADDLAVSVDAAPVDYPDDLVLPTLELLTGISLRRHGATALLRALSRSERATPVPAF